MPQDRRFMVETSGDTVIAVNLKCGFATLNHALIASNPAPAHAYSDDPLMDIERAKRVVMFVRDPPSRFKSFFRNWIVDKIPGTNANQTVYRNVSRFLRPADMKRLTETPAEERNTSEFLRFFTAAMGPALLQERHMAPQWHLLQKYGIAPDSITEIRNFRENTTFLETEYGFKSEVRNATRSSGSDPLDSPWLEEFCRVMYARDYEMFGAHF